MIKAVVFDLDNTLIDFMRMKNTAVEAATKAMIDAGLDFPYNEIRTKIDEIYKEKGEILLLRFAQELEEDCKVESLPKLEGKRMTMLLSPKPKVAKKKK